MNSIKNIFKIGYGPSSSHTMALQKASEIVLSKYPDATFEAILYGSLALTGKGHLSDVVIKKTMKDKVKVTFDLKKVDLHHPNTIRFLVFNGENQIDDITFYSIGGGNIASRIIDSEENNNVYPFHNLNEVVNYAEKNKLTLAQVVDHFEAVDDYLNLIFDTMHDAFFRGISKDELLPGGLNVARRAKSFYQKYLETNQIEAFIYAAALAISEENASAGGLIVTAPTCGSCGVLPAALLYAEEIEKHPRKDIIDSLKVAGLIGEITRMNGSLSGAEVGCQGEVGVACSMAAAAYSYLIKSSNKQIEYASEIALEHHLGLTCDPVLGLVQIPCIERNALASTKAISAARYANLTDGNHKISFDEVVKAMKETGKDMEKGYKETALKGLAGGYK